MATMGRKKAMVRRLVENRRTSISDELRQKREKEARQQETPEEEAERIRILKEAGLIK